MNNTPIFELLLIYFISLIAYSIAEYLFALGAIAILSCSIIIGQLGWYNLSMRSKLSINSNFQTIASISEGCLFFFIGYYCFNYNPHDEVENKEFKKS